MTILSDLKVGARLGLVFAVLVAAALALALFGADRLQAVNQRTAFILEDGYAKVRDAQATHREVSLQARMLTNALIEIGDAEVAAALARAAKADAAAAAAMKHLETLIHSEDGRAAFVAAATARTQYAAAVRSVTKLVDDNNTTSARQTLLDDVLPPLNKYLSALDRLADLQSQGMAQAGVEAQKTARDATLALLLVGAAVAAVAAAAAVLITRSITRPIARALQLATAVAAGDLTTRVDAPERNELGQLLRGLHAMSDSLAKMIAEVRQGSDHIADGSSEIATGNADLSQRTEQQASSLQQTTSSLLDLATAVKRSAANSQEATLLAARASDAATHGSSVVGDVVATMGRIADSSRRIADITGVIDGIAFQTNILALNAAVEAARAGEGGRGFAVVASEVRSLAQRAAAAAREIKTLTGESSQSVEAGARLVRDAGQGMDDIVVQVRRVSALIGDISDGAAEQTGRIDTVSQAVVRIDQVTQQNSALVEQSAAAAESLKEQATMLTRLVGAFRLS